MIKVDSKIDSRAKPVYSRRFLKSNRVSFIFRLAISTGLIFFLISRIDIKSIGRTILSAD